MDKKEVKLNTLRQLEDMVLSRQGKVGPIMDDYDGGQASAYDNVLQDIAAFKAIINHTTADTRKNPDIPWYDGDL